MNILVPDSWLREHLKTNATPAQIKEYLSLSGPSIERIYEDTGEPVYDIEITTNRPDAMSIVGIAREAAVILRQFGLKASFLEDPYDVDEKTFAQSHAKETGLTLTIKTDPQLNPRWASIVLTDVNAGASPKWLAGKLTATGIRPINTIVDITNYLMRAYGQPAHAFDYDAIGKKNGVPFMHLRASRKGETITTLDGKTHTLPGDDIVIEDGEKRLIDLCGIMGGENSSIQPTTRRVILFLQTYDPVRIRKTSMRLAHRTEAAGLFEKGVDSELVLPALMKGVQLIETVAGGKIASKLYDIHPHPYKPATVSVTRTKTDRYLGVSLRDNEIKQILSSLGFRPTITKNTISVSVPSYRRDVSIDVDIIEEIARIYGYHRIESRLPAGEPPMAAPSPELAWEEEVKIRLRDWGYTELYTYSMLSEEQMNMFALPKDKAYKLANPLSSDWVYLRPSLQPSVLAAVKNNLNVVDDVRIFELSKIYHFEVNALPREEDILVVAVSGDTFLELKGLGQAIIDLFGVNQTAREHGVSTSWKDPDKCVSFGPYGSVGAVSTTLLSDLGIKKPVTILDLSITKLVADRRPTKRYVPIPKYPPVVEDFSFVVPDDFAVGPLMEGLKTVHPLITSVTLLDVYENTRTIHVTYQHPERNLTGEDIEPARTQILAVAKKRFGAVQKSA